MKKTFTIGEIKAEARDRLITNLFSPIFVTFLYSITFIIKNMCISNALVDDIFFQISLETLSLLLAVFYGLFDFGLAYYYLNYMSGRKCSAINLFSGLAFAPGRTLVISAILYLIQFVCMLPYEIYYYVIGMDDAMHYAIGIGILFVGYIMNIIINLSFAPIYYILADLPEISIKKAIRLSFWLMKGNKMKYLLLNLSFIPLYLLSLLSFGIALLWVTPYRYCSTTIFYLDLANKKEA